MTLLDKYGIPTPVKNNTIQEPNVMYRFSLHFSDYPELSLYINSVNVKHCGNYVELNVQAHESIGVNLYTKLRNYNSDDQIAILKLLNGNGETTQEIKVKNFTLSNMSMELDYSKPKPVLIHFNIFGEYDDAVE